MPPKTPSKGSKLMSKSTKKSAGKLTANTEKKVNKRKRNYSFYTFNRLFIFFNLKPGKETFSIYIYKVLKQVKQ